MLGFPIAHDGSPSLESGQVLFDHYVVERKLGQGGMGTVWLVRHMGFDSERALKLIVSGIARDPQTRARFRREAHIMDRLNHPNAVRVYDARMGKDVAFIEMEYIRGQSLNQLLVPGEPVPLDWVADFLDQLCDVLQAANDEGIIHRDIKPPNIMLVEGRQPGKKIIKLLDFGIAKIRESGDDDVRTLTGSYLGTPLYSSPEQILGGELDSRSDLYSVGLILFELLTGYRPFNGTVNAVIYKHTSVPPPSFADVNPGVDLPPMVEQVVMSCLAKEPGDRPQSPRELAAMFHHAIAPEGPAAPSTFAHSETQAYYRALDAPSGVVGARAPIPSWPGESRDADSRTIATVPDFAGDPRESRPSRRFPMAWKICLGSLVVLAAIALATDLGSSLRARVSRDLDGLRIGKQVGLLARQGFQVDEAAGKTDGWPNALLDAETRARFRRTPAGIYLPEGYKPGAELAEDGYPRILVREDDGTIFIRIVGGRFTMGVVDGAADALAAAAGAGGARAAVQLPGFYLQKTEVTHGEIASHLEALGGPAACEQWVKRFSRLKIYLRDGEAQASSHPAADITWNIATLHAARRGGRLPTEAQWEFAARSRGMNILYVWEFKEKQNVPLTSRANINTYGDTDCGTAAVGRYPEDVTAQGIVDMTGNVREWCRDVRKPTTAGARPADDPDRGPAAGHAPDAGEERAVRGGSFMTAPDVGQTINREEPHRPDDVTDDIGFRMVIECPEIRRDPR